MTRKLKPCGTYAAYARHLKHNEQPCDPCTAANRERSYAAPSGFNNYERDMAEALAADPPEIRWDKGKGGVMIGTVIRDPHAETKAAREWDARVSREEDALSAMEEQAREVAARFEQHRADNTPLLASARRTI